MARNLVKEAENTEAPKQEEKKEEVKPEKEVVVLTTEQVILNNLNVLMQAQSEMYSKMIEGFKQVGVKFEDKK